MPDWARCLVQRAPGVFFSGKGVSTLYCPFPGPLVSNLPRIASTEKGSEKGSPIRGPGASTNSVSHPDRPSGVMTLPDRARCLVLRAPGFSLSVGCAARPRTSHPSGSRLRAGSPVAGGPGPWHVSRAPENLRCHVASKWFDHRSRGFRRRRVQPLVAHDMGAALETPRRLGPMAVATASNQI